MPVFPETRCPNCGTIGTGRICASCHCKLWERFFEFEDPDGEHIRIDTVGLGRSDAGDGLEKLVICEYLDGELVNHECLFEGKPVKPLGYFWYPEFTSSCDHGIPESKLEPNPLPTGGATGNQVGEASASQTVKQKQSSRSRRRKKREARGGNVIVVLQAQASVGQWGLSDRAIAGLADISPSYLSELLNPGHPKADSALINIKEQYDNRTLSKESKYRDSY
jgi:hypothetical protein